jgi:hypothetical protein
MKNHNVADVVAVNRKRTRGWRYAIDLAHHDQKLT